MRLVASVVLPFVLLSALLIAALARPPGAIRAVAAEGPVEPYAVTTARAPGAAEASAPRPVEPVASRSPASRGESSGGWRWPLSGPARPIRPFDPPEQRWLAGHRGVDLSARPGEEVLAVGPGIVGLAKRVAGRGVVTISHSGGLRTTYLPVRALVRPGDVVAAGAVIGTVEEDTGPHCAVSCLHWGLLRGPVYLDPLLLFGRGQVRLLPRWPVGAVHETTR
ncbi:M23 family metallopeptidase [Microbispora sp. NPDC088329]|uniref:M23 family metallopeptidase n=1 Tax=Microbispora sp. NPDC088329 TaxID=3154869 RepID=UPI00342A193C